MTRSMFENTLFEIMWFEKWIKSPSETEANNMLGYHSSARKEEIVTT